ncbi:MAG: zinc-ribbon domain-containing protein [Sphaerochaetaceae bacterium]|nr:zinc-ribbon domain-containing protein [Sphaerochaetaceae bacterium]
MAYCRKCGAQIDDEAVFCPKCGVLQQAVKQDISYSVSYNNQDRGSFWGGFFLTMFVPVLGLIIALIMGKPDTTKGAVRCIILELILSALLFLLVCCFIVRI